MGGIERYIEKEESPEARQLIVRVQETTVTGMNSRLIARESRLYRSMVSIKGHCICSCFLHGDSTIHSFMDSVLMVYRLTPILIDTISIVSIKGHLW